MPAGTPRADPAPAAVARQGLLPALPTLPTRLTAVTHLAPLAPAASVHRLRVPCRSASHPRRFPALNRCGSSRAPGPHRRVSRPSGSGIPRISHISHVSHLSHLSYISDISHASDIAPMAYTPLIARRATPCRTRSGLAPTDWTLPAR